MANVAFGYFRLIVVQSISLMQLIQCLGIEEKIQKMIIMCTVCCDLTNGIGVCITEKVVALLGGTLTLSIIIQN